MTEPSDHPSSDPPADGRIGDDDLCVQARALLLALIDDPPEELRPLPAPGDLVGLAVYASADDMLGGEAEPVGSFHWVWGEGRPAQELDGESFNERRVDAETGKPRAGVFSYSIQLAPAGAGEWQMGYAFGGLYRERPMFNGVWYWLRREDGHIIVTDTDIWFM